jgi:hypothetical protein
MDLACTRLDKKLLNWSLCTGHGSFLSLKKIVLIKIIGSHLKLFVTRLHFGSHHSSCATEDVSFRVTRTSMSKLVK